MEMIEKLKALSSPQRALDIGKAAEHLVCADLLLSGYHCSLSAQGMPYDIVADVGSTLYRIQVKAVCFPARQTGARLNTVSYRFGVRKCGRGGTQMLGNGEADLVAFIALDIGVIAYLPLKFCSNTQSFLPPNAKRTDLAYLYINNHSFEEAVRLLSVDEAPAAIRADAHERLVEFEGAVKTIKEWSAEKDISYALLKQRLNAGWPVEKAILAPREESFLRKDYDASTMPKSRQAAIEGGIIRYFTGKPCFNGHVSQRHTINGSCIECTTRSFRRGRRSAKEATP